MVFAAFAVTSARAYQFSAVAPTGQALYFTCPVAGVYECGVYPPAMEGWEGYEAPTGELVIPDSVEYQGHSYAVTHVGKMAFNGCGGLTSVTVPTTVTRICEAAFKDCRGMTQITVPSTVTVIEDRAFEYCINLPDLLVPSSVDSVGYMAFYFVRNVIYSGTAVDHSWGQLTLNGYHEDGLYYSDASKTTLTGCIGSAENVTVPSSVTTIGNYAFIACASLTSVGLPSTLTDLGYSAFGYCSSLSSIVIPNSVMVIKNGTFNGCSSLVNVDLGNGITEIGNLVFALCTSLTQLTIPASVTKLGNYVLKDCPSLAQLKSKAQIPPTVGTMTFDGVDKTIPVYIPTGTLSAYQSSWGYFDHFVEDAAISDVAGADSRVTATHGAIVVKDAAGAHVRVFDLAGRLCYQGRVESELWSYRVNGCGCYLVQIGTSPAQKVVVFE